jgi:hypothetical protein
MEIYYSICFDIKYFPSKNIFNDFSMFGPYEKKIPNNEKTTLDESSDGSRNLAAFARFGHD